MLSAQRRAFAAEHNCEVVADAKYRCIPELVPLQLAAAHKPTESHMHTVSNDQSITELICDAAGGM
jgi:hypothetical protein